MPLVLPGSVAFASNYPTTWARLDMGKVKKTPFTAKPIQIMHVGLDLGYNNILPKAYNWIMDFVLGIKLVNHITFTFECCDYIGTSEFYCWVQL